MVHRKVKSSDMTSCFLIDDDVDDQEIFTMALHAYDDSIHCHFADDGVKALEKLRDVNFILPQCIFLDVNMPRMNGIECLDEIRKIRRLQGVPVCMFSTSSDPKIVTQAKALGATDFIVKPPSISALTIKLRQFFHSKVCVK
jgi:CheY-like chemotaxis protein